MGPITVRKWLRRYGRYGVGLLALGWLFTRLDWPAVASFLRGLSTGTVAVLVAVSLAGHLCVFLSWHVLLRRFHRTRLIDAASVSLSLAFLNLSLPSRLPSTVINPFLITERTQLNGSEATAVTIFQTTLFAGCYGLVTLIGLAGGGTQFPAPLVLLLLLSGALYVGFFAAGLALGYGFGSVGRLRDSLVSIPVIGDALQQLAPAPTSITGEVQAAFRVCTRDPRGIAFYVLAWAGGLLFVPGIRVWLLFRAAGVDFTPLFLLPAFVVTAYAITVLPISVGGIGVAEVSATLVFTSLGLPLDVVTLVILADRFFGGYLPGLFGLYPMMDVDFSRFRNE